MSTANTSSRIEVLDSLRGLAALTVVFHHCLLSIPILKDTYTVDTFFKNHPDATPLRQIALWLAYTPLHLLWGGLEAVMIFFVLSGFVLSLPFHARRAPRLPVFWIKRICRIYLPYAAALTVSAILMSLIPHPGVAGLSDWFNVNWSQPISKEHVLNLLWMGGDDRYCQLDNVIWSLVHEMRISLIFPFLMLLVVPFGWRGSLALMAVLAYFWVPGMRWPLDQLPGTWYESARYSLFFFAGALLAKHHKTLGALVERVGPDMRLGLWVLALGILNIRWIHWAKPLLFGSTDCLFMGLAAVMLIPLAMHTPLATRLLRHPALLWLGKVSYSLYLIHVVLLMSLVYGLKLVLPLPVIFVLEPPLALLAAALMYRFVEEPSIRLGKFLTRGFNRPKQPETQAVQEVAA